MKKPTIHPATPRKLRSIFRKTKGKNGKGYNFNATAIALKVNRGELYRLIHAGKEPTDEAIRQKLFLPRKPRRKTQAARAEQPEHIKWWRGRTKQVRQAIILHAKDILDG